MERKFLVISGWPETGIKSEAIRQGYVLHSVDKVVRIRRAGDRGFLTIKRMISHMERDEYEYEIPLEDAEEMLEKLCEKPLIEKERFSLEYKGFTWIIDRFSGENSGLMIAEIELEDVNIQPPIPPWAGMEVTSDPRYLNSSLARKPYKTWSDE